MKTELPCDIVRDLLPSYIDGLASEGSRESVEGHLEYCQDCKSVYSDMSKEYQKKDLVILEENKGSEQEKALFKKINKKLNKRVIAAIAAGLAAVILAVGLSYVLYNEPIMPLNVEDVTVSAQVFPIEELTVLEKSSTGEEVTVITYSDEGEIIEQEKSVALQFPGGAELNISEGMLEEYDYITAITWKSKYNLRNILWEYPLYRTGDTIYVKGFRTTFLNNDVLNENDVLTTFEMKEINKIIYVHKDGTETLLWENK